jgi:hypothetical protein
LSSLSASIRARLTRRRVILLLAPPALFLLYVLVGFFGVPWYVRGPAMNGLSEGLHGRASVERVRFNPFTFEMRLEKLRVVDDTGTPVAGFDEAYADAQVSSLWRGAWVLRQVTLKKPFGDGRVDEAGVLNLVKLIKPRPASDKPSDDQATAFEIDRLEVIDASLAYADASLDEPFAHRAEPISFTLDGFKTRPDHQNPYTFTATTSAGERVSWEGTFYLDPLTSDGRLTLEQIDVPTYFPFYSRFTHCQVAAGKLAVKLSYRFGPARSPRTLSAAVESVELTDLSLRPRESEEPFFTLPSATLTGVDADAVSRTLSVKKIALKGGELLARRDPRGKVAVIQYFSPRTSRVTPTTQPASAPATPPSSVLEAGLMAIFRDARQPWDVTVESIELLDQQLAARDQAAARPIALDLSEVSFTAGPIRSRDAYAVPLKLQAKVRPAGSLAIDGTLYPLEPAADVQLKVTDADLTPADAYWGAFLAASLPSGRLSLDGRLRSRIDADGAVHKHYEGSATLKEAKLVKRGDADPIASLSSLHADGIVADAAFTREGVAYDVGVKELTLDEPFVHVIVTRVEEPASPARPDEKVVRIKTNLEDLLASPLPLPRGVRVDTIRLTGGRAVMDDLTQPAAAKLHVSDLEATATGIADAADARITLEARGKIDGESPFELSAALLPAEPLLDTRVALKMAYTPLVPFDPYGKRYLGYGIDRGKLNLDVSYTIKASQLQGENRLHLDTFYLAERFKSPDAVDLPIKLAVSLLRDRKEQINLDVPVTGDLSDPKFSVFKIVMQALGTTLEKVVAAPFDTLASLLGAKDVDLGRVAFAPGSSELSADEAKKLDLLVRALEERPGLVLAMRGLVDEPADGPALRRRHLKEALAQEMPAAGGEATAVLSELDYRVAVARMYQRLGGAAPADEPPTREEPTPAKKDGKVRRFVKEIFAKDKPRAEQKPAAQSAEPAAQPGAVSFDAMEAAVLATVELDAAELPDLAKRRRETVRAALVTRLDAARLIDDSEEKEVKPAAAVVFDLR